MRVKLSWFELLATVPLIAVCGGLLMLALLLPVRDVDRTHGYPPPASRAASVPAGVVGEYYLGDGLGTNASLSILLDGRYSLIESGCTGVHDRESGFVLESNSSYVLSPIGPADPSRKRNLVLVAWGQRHYLIPPDEMQDLREAIIDGREPRDDVHGRFYVSLPLARADGLPDSPPAWASAIRDGLVLGRVTTVSAVGRAKLGRAKVNLGAKKGCARGTF